MPSYSRLLIQKDFEQHPITRAQLDSYNWFVDVGLKEAITDVGTVKFDITPPDVNEAYLKAVDVRVDKAQIIDTGGIIRRIYPYEARLRQITYSAPIYVTFHYYEDGELKEEFEAKIGELPVMIRSKLCNTYALSEEELLKVYEDPRDPGGYFIVNGVDRVVVMEENLAPNTFYVSKGQGSVIAQGKVLSITGTRKIPITISLKNDGILYISFSKFDNLPLIPLLKIIGLTDAEIIQYGGNYEELLINVMEFADQDYEQIVLGRIKIPGVSREEKEVKYEKLWQQVDEYLLPHIGTTPEWRRLKAITLLKYVQKLLRFVHGEIEEDDKDHYMNKRIMMVGELFGELIRLAFRKQLLALKYSYQRIAKRKRIDTLRHFLSVTIFNQTVEAALTTDKWPGGRSGISQVLDKTNYLAILSYLTKITTPLDKESEVQEARQLHGTHWGRLDPIETPEGRTIGLRKNLALLARVTTREDENKVLEVVKELGAELETPQK